MAYCRCGHPAIRHGLNRGKCVTFECQCVGFVGPGSEAYNNGVVAHNPFDPANFLLESSYKTTPEVYLEGCYICEDPEYAAMGLPLCYACPCGPNGHVPADDISCTSCGESFAYDKAMAQMSRQVDTPDVHIDFDDLTW